MFAWASSTFENLIQTVAPAPTDPNTRILYCCQQGDEQAALQCLQQTPESIDAMPIDPIRSVVVQSKGYTPLHLACLHTMPAMLDYILSCNQSGDSVWQVQDVEGNSPLHCACMSNSPNALQMVKKIIMYRCGSGNDDPPSVNVSLVVAKNFRNETPYDVAALNSVRQYLLPIQLQAETQAAIDNGGAGLPPGIDMGGLKIQYSNLPPPPSFAGVETISSAGTSTPRYAAPSIPGMGGLPQAGQQTKNPNMSTAQFQAPQQPLSVAQAPPIQQSFASIQQAAPSHLNTQSDSTLSTQTPNLSTPTTVGPNAAPRSAEGYSLTGRSSAAIYSGSRGRFVPNDGFHSSSSDKNLQAKYGHAVVTPAVKLPPPPSSGNSGLATSLANAPPQTHSAPSSTNTTPSYNPFAAGDSALGGRRIPAGSRYVSYDPVRGTSVIPLPPPPPPPSSRGISPAASASTFSVFTPLGSNSNNIASAPAPVPNHQQSLSSSNNFSIPPLPPPPSVGSRTTAFNGLSVGSGANLFPSPNNQFPIQPTPANTPNVSVVSFRPEPFSPTKAADLFSSSSSQVSKESPSFRISRPPGSGNASDLFGVPQGVNSSVSSSGGSSIVYGSPQKQNAGSAISASSLFSAPPATPSLVTSSTSPAFPSPLVDSSVQPLSHVDNLALSSTLNPGTNTVNPVKSLGNNVASWFDQPAPISEHPQASSEPLVTPRAANDDPEPTESAVQDDDDEGMMDEIPLTPWPEQEKKTVVSFNYNEREPQSSAASMEGFPSGNSDLNIDNTPPLAPPFNRG